MKGLGLNPYFAYARAFPVYITIVPVALVMFAILPEGFDWQLGGLASFVFLPLSYLCKQISRLQKVRFHKVYAFSQKLSA